MTTRHQFDLYDQLEDLEGLPPIRNIRKDHWQYHQRSSGLSKVEKNPEIDALENQEKRFNFSYGASKHEKAWLDDSLEDFYRQNWFDDILRLIKGGGKEASVYQCLANESIHHKYIAAKVYRPRKFRQLRNDSLYREGRQHLDDEGHEVRDDRALHAIQKRTNFGKRLLHTSWIEHEFQTMSLLYKAGADVPEPLASGNNAILMAYVGWDELPAPTLNTVKLSRIEAQAILEKVIKNVDIMLENHRVHGDLSAYNILYLDGEIFLIDFPQAIDPHVNRNAYAIFKRDLTRLCEYFQAQNFDCSHLHLAQDLWQKHGYSTHPAVDTKLLEPEFGGDIG
jgi:RIO kinase 1